MTEAAAASVRCGVFAPDGDVKCCFWVPGGATIPQLPHLTFIKSLSSKCAQPLRTDLPADASDLLWVELLPPNEGSRRRILSLWGLVSDELLNDILQMQTSLIIPLKKLAHMRKTAVLPGGCVIHTHDEQERRARPREACWTMNRSGIEPCPAAGTCLEQGTQQKQPERHWSRLNSALP